MVSRAARRPMNPDAVALGQVPSKARREYNVPMVRSDEDMESGPDARLRQPGWVALLIVLAASCLMMGAVLLGMLEAPVVPHKVIAAACVCIALGLVLIPVAWMGRRK